MKTTYFRRMTDRLEPSLKIAEFLLRIKAVKLDAREPFTWASGWKSPIYCDNRKVLSHPTVRTFVRQQFVEVIQAEFPKPDIIAGVATGGIAHGALVANDMGLPFVYVRSGAKEHGMRNQVEGDLEMGRNVLVLEDLVSTGKSSLQAVEALRSVGCEVKGMVSIFTYGFPTAHSAFERAGVRLVPLTDYRTLLDQAVRSNYLSEAEALMLSEWSGDPGNWKGPVPASAQV
jgi:orotate phosphoribosyltransferase